MCCLVYYTFLTQKCSLLLQMDQVPVHIIKQCIPVHRCIFVTNTKPLHCFGVNSSFFFNFKQADSFLSVWQMDKVLKFEYCKITNSIQRTRQTQDSKFSYIIHENKHINLTPVGVYCIWLFLRHGNIRFFANFLFTRIFLPSKLCKRINSVHQNINSPLF